MSEGNVCFLLERKLITLSTILKQVWAFTIVGERTRNSRLCYRLSTLEIKWQKKID